MSTTLSVHQEDWSFKEPFRISGYVSYSEPAIVVELQDGDLVGRGEAEGIYYFDETTASMVEQVKQVAADVEGGADRMDLLDLLPPGGARCAIDSALWDLEAKRAGKRVWELVGLELKRIVTVFTIGLEEEPAEMARKAAAAEHPILKVKLDADRPVEKIEAIRAVRPDATIVIDANQDWSFQQLVEVAPRLHGLGVTMIEQPLPRGADGELEGYQAPGRRALPDDQYQARQERRPDPRARDRTRSEKTRPRVDGGLHVWNLARHGAVIRDRSGVRFS
jgi:L-alanine-DL-glutamate epimerase-like enolase superfamily enzyme